MTIHEVLAKAMHGRLRPPQLALHQSTCSTRCKAEACRDHSIGLLIRWRKELASRNLPAKAPQSKPSAKDAIGTAAQQMVARFASLTTARMAACSVLQCARVHCCRISMGPHTQLTCPQ
eukprot:556933-Amphidinium_carterae.2